MTYVVIVELSVVLAGSDDIADALGDFRLHLQRVFQSVYAAIPALAFWRLLRNDIFNK